MGFVPSKVADRLSSGLKRYQGILSASKARDVGEADTVTIVKDMLADVFGYDKYAEVTSEHSIKSTFCDLAIKIDGTVQMLIEVKAIGTDLKDIHVKQAVDYAVNQGVNWVILTNSAEWRVYHVVYSKPIGQDLVLDINVLGLNPKSSEHIEQLYLWCKEGLARTALEDYEAHKQALSRFLIGAILLSDPVLEVVRRELRRVSQLNREAAEIRIEIDQIGTVIINEVIKRDVLEGDKADEAKKKVARAASKTLRNVTPKLESKAADRSARVLQAPSDSL
jgi:Type I restriction enzyme R protein N terminus (HSDR_N)